MKSAEATQYLRAVVYVKAYDDEIHSRFYFHAAGLC